VCVCVCVCVCVSVCVCVQHGPDWARPVHNNTAPHSCTGGLVGFNGRGSIQTLWGPTHTKSGGTEQEEGEGAHFSPPGHRSSEEIKFLRIFILKKDTFSL